MTPSTPSTTLFAQPSQPRNATQLIGDLYYGVLTAVKGWAMFALGVQVMKLVAGPQDFATILRMVHGTEGRAIVGASMVVTVGVGLTLGVLRPFRDQAWAAVLVGGVIAVPLTLGGAWVNGWLSSASPGLAWILVLAPAGVLGGGWGFAFWKADMIDVRQAAVARVIDQTELPVNAETVLRELRKALFPVLRAQGFTVFGDRGAWRYREGRIEAVCFRVPDWNPWLAAEVGSFQVTLGVYLTCVPVEDDPVDRLEGQLTPNADQCHLCCNVRDTWTLRGPEGTSLKWAIACLSSRLSDLTWFPCYGDDFRVLEHFLRDVLYLWDGTRLAGGSRGWMRQRVMGYLHLKLGNRREALRHLKALQEEVDHWARGLPPESSAEESPKMERLARDVAFLELDV